MKLELAIVQSCTDTGCLVKPIHSNEAVAVTYSNLVKDRIQIRSNQLVAIDTITNPPKIVWRWVRASVIELVDNTVYVVGEFGHRIKVVYVSSLPLTLNVDDDIWSCRIGNTPEIHDKSVDGKPVHPYRLLKYITPIIEDVYQKGTSK